jgi:hypothetical protein
MADVIDIALAVSADGQYEAVAAENEAAWARPARGAAWTTCYLDGREYLGAFQGWTFHGRGYLHWPDGRVYVGQFRAGRRHGMGRQRWPDGYSYAGDWKQGARHGHGAYRDPAGRVARALWIEDRCVLAPHDPHRFETDEDGESTLPGALGLVVAGAGGGGGGDDEVVSAFGATCMNLGDEKPEKSNTKEEEKECDEGMEGRRRYRSNRSRVSEERFRRRRLQWTLGRQQRERAAEKVSMDARARSIEERQAAWREEMNLAFDLEHLLKCSSPSSADNRRAHEERSLARAVPRSTLIFQQSGGASHAVRHSLL